MLVSLARWLLPRHHVSSHVVFGRGGREAVIFDGGRPVVVAWWQWGNYVWAVRELAVP